MECEFQWREPEGSEVFQLPEGGHGRDRIMEAKQNHRMGERAKVRSALRSMRKDRSLFVCVKMGMFDGIDKQVKRVNVVGNKKHDIM